MPNDYNPNVQAVPESRLLTVSLIADGWTQPIVVHRATRTIVDGEHRWLAAADPQVADLTGGLIPVVWIEGGPETLRMSTIRHNRARGTHAVLPMARIVRSLLESGMPGRDLMELLQMEAEEIERLAEHAGRPEVIARDKTAFSAGWVPGQDRPAMPPVTTSSALRTESTPAAARTDERPNTTRPRPRARKGNPA